NVRALDRQRVVVRESIRLRREAQEVLQARVDAGTAPELDRARADTEVAIAEAEMVRLERQRSSSEIALSILAGTAAPQFAIAEVEGQLPVLPAIPPSLPSELLERRP